MDENKKLNEKKYARERKNCYFCRLEDYFVEKCVHAHFSASPLDTMKEIPRISDVFRG